MKSLLLLLLPLLAVLNVDSTEITTYLHVQSEHANGSECVKFIGRKLNYYSNCSSTFRISLVISGDVHPNPGPSVTTTVSSDSENYGVTSTANKHPITYDKDALLKLRTKTYLPRDIWSTVCQLGLGCKPTRRGKKGGIKARHKVTVENGIYHHRSSTSSSDSVTLTPFKDTCKLCLINSRSVCNKTHMLVDHLMEHDIDVMCICETWLSSTEKHRKVIGDLTPLGYNISHIPRSHGTGGGVAIVYRESIGCKSNKYEATSFECLCCDMKFTGASTVVKVVVIYRPPYSVRNRATYNVFFDEFSIFLSQMVSSASNMIIVGDFTHQRSGMPND